MGTTVSGGNFGVDYPLALACGQAAKSGRSFQMQFMIPFPIILSFECAKSLAELCRSAVPGGSSNVQRRTSVGQPAE